jgi:hypothetical protein
MPESTSIDQREEGVLHTLRQGLDALARAKLSVQAADVAAVESFWSADGMDFASGGFVLRLEDGNRVYLDVWIEAPGKDELTPTKIDVDIVPLAAGQRHPHFPSRADPIGGWQDDVAPLNAFLQGTLRT